jgi:tRNA-2-methylthio-N6-dimethylallyladenosine synthase
MPDQVPDAVKVARLHTLQKAIDRDLAAFNTRCVGRTLPVLFEKKAKRPGQIVGRSPYLQPVHVMAPDSIVGQVGNVIVTGLEAYSLFGTLAEANLTEMREVREITEANATLALAGA